MTTPTMKPLCLALGLALAGPAAAVQLDFSGSNIYMKFLDGNQRKEAGGSIDTASGGDQGQFSELELRIKATISPQVEAGARIQSRSSAAYWSEFGFQGEDDSATSFTHKKFMKLRGAYVQLTPGYSWLNTALIGSSDWGMFDPFTVGKMRYIDRDNLNGVYFKGPLAKGSWEAAWVSMAEYLGPEFSAGDLEANDGTFIVQVKQPVGPVKLTGILQRTSDQERDPADVDIWDGQTTDARMRNTVFALKAEGSIMDGLDASGAFYRSSYDTNKQLADWSNLLGNDYDDNAFLINVDWSQTPLDNFSVRFQHFNIGAGYVSATAARRESDVLLTEGSEAAWYGWGDSTWLGGRANDMLQVPITIRDNDYTDFDETGAESSIGWKGNTLLFGYEVADTPMSLELSRIDYNQNWQNWGGDQDIFNVISWGGPTGPGFREDQDRKTDILVFKANHQFPVAGGLDLGFKYKWVKDKDKRDKTTSADNYEAEDSGFSVTVGNQLHNDLYGSISYGLYNRDISLGSDDYDNSKSIWSLRLSYNLSGFEAGLLTQYVDGDGDPTMSGTKIDFSQYRTKAFLKAIF
ncbi:MAG: hypothetical protein ACOZB0_09270 [Pseudomonadota bacterium]